MITKLLVSGYSPVNIVSASSADNYVNVTNYSSVDMYISLDGTSNLTTITGATPGILLQTGSSYIVRKNYINDDMPARPIWAVMNGTGASYPIVIQKW